MPKILRLNNGFDIPVNGIGTWQLNVNDLQNAFEAAQDNGITLIDTADSYGNEADVGNLLRGGCLQDAVLTTKVHIPTHRGKYKYFPWLRKTVTKAFKESCEKLGRNPDIYLLHHCNGDYIRRFRQLIKLYRKGAVKAIGVCNADIANLQRIIDETGFVPQICQVQLHPLYSKKRLIEFCRSHGIICEAHTQFALGDTELLENPVLVGIAACHDKSVYQVILRWLYQQGVVTIPRSSKPENIKSNAEIFDFNLSEMEMEKIDALNRNKSVKAYDVPSDKV